MKIYPIALLFFALSSSAQGPVDKKYKDCDAEDTCYYCGDVPARYKKNIRDRIQWCLDHGTVKWMSTGGRTFFEIQVDSMGHSCVRSTKDETHMADVTDNVRRCINGLWDWHPAETDHHPINSTVMLELHFVGNRAQVRFVSPVEAE